MKLDFANLHLSYQDHKEEIDSAMFKVISGSNFIMGQPLIDFEHNLERFTGAKHAISCSSGTDALLLVLMAIDVQPGDEIITTPFTFIATAEVISLLKAVPVFVDIEEETYHIDASRLEEKITSKTKAIIPVSIFGQTPDMDAINEIAERNNLFVIEDSAQSFGATYKGKKSCNLSTFACTSFFPAKPLGCFGDGGAIFSDNDLFSEKIKSLRLHGQTERYCHKYVGIGGRLDTLQAAILDVKLKYYEKDISERNRVASLYKLHLQDSISTPVIREGNTSVWAQFSIRVKDRLKVTEGLKNVGIPTAVHYPRPLHLQECFQNLSYDKGDFPVAETVSDEIMSLPMNPYLSEEEIVYISTQLKLLIE